MMEANNFRIGNVAQDFHRNTYEINNDIMVDIIGGYMKLDPIPLTKEWLDKFGFTYNQTDHFDYHVKPISEIQETWLMIQSNNMYWIGYGDCMDNDASVVLGCIEYVHQLQNLYFALAKKEL